MGASSGLRSMNPKILIICTAILVFATTFLFFPRTQQEAPQPEKVDYHAILGDQLNSFDLEALSPQFRELYKPILVPVDAPSFMANGTSYNADHIHWTEPLGQDLCIADIDTRSFGQHGQLLSEDFSWQITDPLSAGMLNHYLYASIHGYTYHLIQPEAWPNDERDGVWTKLPALRKLLDVCRVVLMIDGDLVIQHSALPLEWLMNRWDVSRDTGLALPWDVWQRNDDDRYNPHGMPSMNAGVVIAQSSARSKEMIDAWIACPDDKEHFPGCQRFKHSWPAEQGAFNEYIQEAFNEPSDVGRIPCDEANGFPGQEHEGNDLACTGVFLRHFTSEKESTKVSAAQVLMQDLSYIFAKQFHRGG